MKTNPVQIDMSWEEAEKLHGVLSKQWHQGIVAEFVVVLGQRLKENPNNPKKG